jgi:hypothetical protein
MGARRGVRATVALALVVASCKTGSLEPSAREEASGRPAPGASLEAKGAALDAGSRAKEERIYVVSGSVDVVENPAAGATVLGTIRAGGSALVAPRAREEGSDCKDGWIPILPRGFMCASDKTTRDPSTRTASVLFEYGLARSAALPASYGVAEVTPIYLRVPTWDEQLRAEPELEEHLHKRAALRAAREVGRKWGDVSAEGDRDLDPVGAELPDDVKAGSIAPFAPRRIMPSSPVTGFLGMGARVAWLAEFDAQGRTWLLTPDWLFVPRDKVKRALVSGFHGIDVPPNTGVTFTGRRPARRFRRDANGKKFVTDQGTFPPDTVVALAAPTAPSTEVQFLETSEPGLFVCSDEVILVDPSPPARFGLDFESGGDQRWVDIDARSQVLLLRDGSSVTFATLASSPMNTRRGKFRISSKHLTAPMPFERDRAGSKAEVPLVVLVAESKPGLPGSALFAAWWMSSWGSSSGIFGVALSPLDARRIFDFAAPELPDGWHSVRGEGTWVVVHD